MADSVAPAVIEEYRKRQRELARAVIERPLTKTPTVIAAVDVHLRGTWGVAAAVAYAYPSLEEIAHHIATGRLTFPYIPGLLSYREAPLCLEAIRGLPQVPDLILVDGQGRAHPRRAGIACHIGVELGLPTIGVAKSILVGHHGPLGEERGSVAPLIADDEVVGMAVRTRTGVSPVYVSVGHLVTLEDAVEWTLRTTTRYRLPEPSRRAHRLAQDAARALQTGADGRAGEVQDDA